MGITGSLALAVGVAIVVGLTGPVAAQPTSAERERLFRQQVGVLDKRGTSQYAFSSRLMPQTDWDGVLNLPQSGGNSDMRRRYMPIAMDAARRHRVPETLFARLVTQESAWNPQAVSHKGAIGLAQLMPGTARGLGVDPRDPRENLEGGARYLRQQYNRFGSWRLALAAYNAGPGAVERHGGVPPYRETENYVRVILAGLG